MKNFATKTLAMLIAGLTALSCAEDGADGGNGLGFDELTKFGSMEVTLEGTLPNGETFNESTDFSLSFGVNTVLQDVEGGVHDFFISYDSVDLLSFVDISFSVTDIGEATENISFLNLLIGDVLIISEGNKFFNFEEEEFFFSDVTTPATNDIITNLTFNETTGELSFSFAFEVDGEDNETGNDLSISGTVDAIVLEEINSGGTNPEKV